MTKFKRLQLLLIGDRKLIPEDMKLWKRINKLLEGKTQDDHIKNYEKMGGNWKIAGDKEPAIDENFDAEFYQIYGIDHDEKTYKEMESLKKHDPLLYKKMLNWD